MQVEGIIKKSTGGGRNSNLEMLRLLSMLMVLILHSFWGYTHGSGVLQALDFFRECAAICAVNVFLLISGYFEIRWKLKSLFNLVFQLFFYAFLVYIVAVLLGVIDFSLKGLLRNATCLYSHWGFITYYLLLYLCSPLLNAFVEKVTEKQLLGFIIILIISEWFFTRDNSFLNYSFLHYCTIYLIGRYISVSGAVLKNSIKPGLYYWLITILIFVFVFITFKFIHVTDAYKMQSLPWGLSYAAPLVILQAIFLFIWFARLKFQNKTINWCAASCLSIFLIHMHPAIKEIGYYSYTESLYTLPVVEHIWKLALLMIVVFFGSIVVDKIRILISSIAYRFFLCIISKSKLSNNNIVSYIPNIVNNHG